ncbi:D-aminoacyl-tRNA deacylase, partial [Nanoarchaeota archaeon]
MNFAIIVSRQDPAGLNIKENLLKDYSFKEVSIFDKSPVYELDEKVAGKNKIRLFTIEEKSISFEYPEEKITDFDIDIVLFATKHQGKEGVKSLCIHTPGNWGKAEYGGEDEKLCIAPIKYLKTGHDLLEKNNTEFNLNWQVIQECTHHGPYSEKPVIFMEIGSTEEEWPDKQAGNLLAKSIIELLTEEPDEFDELEPVFGIGGLHHTPQFTKISKRSNFAFGHVCAKYQLETLNTELIFSALN